MTGINTMSHQLRPIGQMKPRKTIVCLLHPSWTQPEGPPALAKTSKSPRTTRYHPVLVSSHVLYHFGKKWVDALHWLFKTLPILLPVKSRMTWSSLHLDTPKMINTSHIGGSSQ